MRTPWLVIPLGLSLLALPSVASAQGAQGNKSAATAANGSNGTERHDPNGIKGISPFWEDLNKGDAAYIARDFAGAIAAYRDAITKEPHNAMGHYRMGEAELAKGSLNDAQASWESALNFVGSDASLKAKILFCLADLNEREKKYDDAIALWQKYLALAKASPKTKMFPESAESRIKVIQTWKKMLTEYAAVKQRIAEHLKEAEAKAKKNAR